MKLTKSKLKQIIKEELGRVIRETENQTDMIPYEDYDAWDSDPNLERIKQILSSELNLEDFKFRLSTDFPGQYQIASRGDIVGLQNKTGHQLQDVEDALQANGYKTSYGHDGLAAFDPRYEETQ